MDLSCAYCLLSCLLDKTTSELSWDMFFFKVEKIGLLTGSDFSLILLVSSSSRANTGVAFGPEISPQMGGLKILSIEALWMS